MATKNKKKTNDNKTMGLYNEFREGSDHDSD